MDALSVSDRIASTQLSEQLKDALWFTPTSQSIHIIALSVVFACALLIGLQLAGVGRAAQPLHVAIRKKTLFMYVGLIALLITGALQTIAEPQRQFGSPAFWIKMVLIVFGLLLTWWVARGVRREPQRWEDTARRPAWSRPYALVYVTTWIAIIFCGRFIGYT